MNDIQNDTSKVEAELDQLIVQQVSLRDFYEADWDGDNQVMGTPVPSAREVRIMNSTREQLQQWIAETA
jgi:hypothetical protein